MIRPVRLPILRCLALSLLTHWAGAAGAVGLGPIRVQSALGQPLSVQIPLIGNDAADLTSTCIKTRLQSADGAAIGAAVASLQRTPRGDAILLTTRQTINEPAILVDVNITCGPLVHRDYSILLDPIGMMPILPDAATRSLAESEAAGRLPSPREQGRRNRTNAAGGSDNNDGRSSDFNGVRQRRSAAPDISAGPRAEAPVPRATAKPVAPRKNVLKLSNEGFTDAELASMGQLKLSNTISEAALPVDAAQREGLMAARNLFAQMLRGEDPAQVIQAERATSAQQVATLQGQMANINRQRAADRAALDDLKQNSWPLNWVFVLLGGLLLSLLGIGFLAWRLLVSKKQTESAWDLALARQEPAGSAVPNTPADDAAAAAAVASKVAPSSVIKNTASKPISSVAPASVTNKQAAPKAVSTDFGHNPGAQQNLPTADTGADKLPALDQDNALALPVTRADLEFLPVVPKVSAVKPANAADHNEAMQFYSSKVEHLKVEEISDVMQEAEFWMSLNDPQRAIEILEPYAEVEIPDSPMPWLYLLDLYRGTDEQLKYTLLQEKAARIFNVRIALWDEDADLMDGRTLEDFPHVVEQICTYWETNNIFSYLESLIFDQREGGRSGFDLSVYQEIMMLLMMARSDGRDRVANPFSGADASRLTIE